MNGGVLFLISQGAARALTAGNKSPIVIKKIFITGNIKPDSTIIGRIGVLEFPHNYKHIIFCFCVSTVVSRPSISFRDYLCID